MLHKVHLRFEMTQGMMSLLLISFDPLFVYVVSTLFLVHKIKVAGDLFKNERQRTRKRDSEYLAKPTAPLTRMSQVTLTLNGNPTSHGSYKR